MRTISNTWRWILGGLFTLILLFFIWYLRNLVIYILISGIISIIAKPLTQLLCKLKIGRFKIPSGLSAFLVLLTIWFVIIGLMAAIIPIVAAEMRVLSKIDYNQIWIAFEGVVTKFDMFMKDFGVFTGEDHSSIMVLQNKLQGFFNISDLTSLFSVFFSGVGNIGVAFFSISFITFFFIREGGLFKKMMLEFVPRPIENQVLNVVMASKELLARYFIGITIQVALITTCITSGLLILGVENAFIIGLFAGFINLIPYIGPFIGAAVGMLITLTAGLQFGVSSELLFLMAKVAGVFLTVQLIDNILFQPIIFSNSVKAHPLEIFLVISIGGTLGGIPLMIMAIPGYTVLRIIAKEFLSEFKLVQDLTKRI
ncbi:MAG: AI-2E family transporter [Salibacteraceae bacterium]